MSVIPATTPENSTAIIPVLHRRKLRIGEVHHLAKNSQPDSGGAWTGYWGDKIDETENNSTSEVSDSL